SRRTSRARSWTTFPQSSRFWKSRARRATWRIAIDRGAFRANLSAVPAIAAQEHFGHAADLFAARGELRRQFHAPQARHVAAGDAHEMRVLSLFAVLAVVNFEAPHMIAQLGAHHEAR